MSKKRRNTQTVEPHDIIIDGVTVLTVEKNNFPEIEKQPENIEDLGDIPEIVINEESEANSPAQFTPAIIPGKLPKSPDLAEEVENLKKLCEQLNLQNLKLAEEMKQAKSAPKKLDFAEMQKIITKKSVLLSNLTSFETHLKTLDELGDISQKGELFENSKFCITLARKDYREEQILKTSNTLILGDFIEFMKARIKDKIAELTEEIETLDI